MPSIIFLLTFGAAYLLGECHGQNENMLIEAPFENRFSPNWKDLDKRPLPEWYDKAKIGIFLHWGLYCVPGFRSEWFWSYWKGGDKSIIKYMTDNYPPGFTYQDFAPMFKAEFFNPNQFAELFAKAGAKYVVLTSKHHEGFTLFPSSHSFSWNSVEAGPHRDLVGDIAEAVRAKDLKFGVYHSLYEWYNQIYLEDKNANFTTRNFVNNKLWPDLKQLVNDYKPSVIWADGDWEADDTYWRSTDFLSWLYNDSPVKNEVVVNDRWGRGIGCKHGDFYNCFDRYNPGKLQNHKWENAFTLDLHSWGHRRNMNFTDVMCIHRLLYEVISTISCGGNALINIGPTKEGTIAPIFEERLLQLGEWLQVNGQAIYGTHPWVAQNDTLNGHTWYTCTKDLFDPLQPISKGKNDETVTAVYAIFLKWPSNENTLVLRDITKYLNSKVKVTLLGNENMQLKWKTVNNVNTAIHLPCPLKVKSKYAWTLKFTNLN